MGMGKEAQMLVVDANEKLQMALSREQTLIQKTNDQQTELQLYRTQDIQGINTMLLEKLNQTRNRISELEQAHAERLDVINKLQINNLQSTFGGQTNSFTNNSAAFLAQTNSALDNEQVDECQNELMSLMGVIGQLHGSIREELDS